MPAGRVKPVAEQSENLRVEGLLNFPFPSFYEFARACTANTAQPFMSRSAACRWARIGVHSSPWLKFKMWVLGTIPFAALLSFLIYAMFTEPLLLLGVPLLVLAYIWFNPIMIQTLRILAWGPLILTFGIFIWALVNRMVGLAILTSCLLVIWFSQRLAHNEAGMALDKSLTEHEDLLCQAWMARTVGIKFPDGRICWVDHESPPRQN